MKADTKIVIMLAAYAFYMLFLFIFLAAMGQILVDESYILFLTILILVLLAVNAILIKIGKSSLILFTITILVVFINSILMVDSMYDYHPLFSLNFLVSVYIPLFMIVILERNVQKKYLKVKRKVLEYSTMYSRLNIDEIAEKCRKSKATTWKIVNDMISNNELKGNFNRESNFIEFDNIANIQEIDELLQKYKDWEINKIGKWKE